MHGLDRRTDARELLDGETLDPQELRANLREMAMLNRLPGGTGASLAAIRRLIHSDEPRILDVGTGGADLPRRIRREIPGAMVIAIDAREEVVALARRWTRPDPCVELRIGSAEALPLVDASVDVAHASLLIHHLSPAEAVNALREMRRVARDGVVVNDLRRGRLAFEATRLTVLALARARYTRHDGVLSARRAYTVPELDEIAAAAGLGRVWRSPAFMPRVVTAYR